MEENFRANSYVMNTFADVSFFILLKKVKKKFTTKMLSQRWGTTLYQLILERLHGRRERGLYFVYKVIMDVFSFSNVIY